MCCKEKIQWQSVTNGLRKEHALRPPFQCGKPFISNTRQNGEWTETSTHQNEIKLAMFGE